MLNFELLIKNIMIRKIRKHELNDLLDLYTHMHEQDDPLPDMSTLNEVWSSILDNPGISYFVAESDGKIVSTCHLVIVPNLSRAARPYGVIENVVTHTYRFYEAAGFDRHSKQAFIAKP